MGVTTFALANVLLAYAVKDPLRSVFSLDTFADRRLLQMSAISVVAGVRERIHRTLPLRNFFRNPTIEQMARVLEESSLVSAAPSAAS